MDKQNSVSDGRIQIVRQYGIRAETAVLAIRTSDPLDRDHTKEIRRRDRMFFPGSSRLGKTATRALLRLVPYFTDPPAGGFIAFCLDGWAFLVPESKVDRA